MMEGHTTKAKGYCVRRRILSPSSGVFSGMSQRAMTDGRVDGKARGPVRGRVVSRDGTVIAYDRVGSGPPVVLVLGALCSRALGPGVKLAALLADWFTVFTYDRRGRGDSGDTAPYEVAREIEDLAALIAEAGGPACVFGHSSGAVLALRAAAQGLPIAKLALYEAPLIVDGSRPSTESDWTAIDAFVRAGRPADAVKGFLKMVGVPAFAVAIMRWLPVWAKVTAVAHTLPYDGALVRAFQRGEPLPGSGWAHVAIPTLALDGGKSPAWMRTGMKALAASLAAAGAPYRTLEGQTHDVSAKVLAPVLREFFATGGP
jgi:pimeloyl-ACP methyl ester carboxylesterase